MNTRREIKRTREICRNRESAKCFFILLCVGITCLLLFACKSAPQSPVIVGPGVYELPVKSENLAPAPGKNKEDIIAVIVVPPSDKATTVQIYKKHRPLVKKLFPSREEQTITPIADNPAAEVSQQKKTPWWLWAGGLAGGFGVLWIFGRKYLGAPLKILVSSWKLISKTWRVKK